MKEDIAGATFMATASSSPELFINCVGTFITEGDLGVGTIVGSAVFNVLAVPACCGLFANMVLQLDWWPITRDSLVYGVAVVMLIGVLDDSRVELWEAIMLVSTYLLYILCKFLSKILRNFSEKTFILVKEGQKKVFFLLLLLKCHFFHGFKTRKGIL